MNYSYSGPQNIRKSHLTCLPRPLIMILALGVNFEPLRAKISQIAWGTPTFYCTPRLYLPIGIQKYTYFCWCIFFYFWLVPSTFEAKKVLEAIKPEFITTNPLRYVQLNQTEKIPKSLILPKKPSFFSQHKFVSL